MYKCSVDLVQSRFKVWEPPMEIFYVETMVKGHLRLSFWQSLSDALGVCVTVYRLYWLLCVSLNAKKSCGTDILSVSKTNDFFRLVFSSNARISRRMVIISERTMTALQSISHHYYWHSKKNILIKCLRVAALWKAMS